MIGGLNASITPLIGYLGPFFVLAFLLKLSKIIKDHLKDDYDKQLRNYIKTA